MTATLERQPLEFSDILPMVWRGETTPVDALRMDVSEHFLLNIAIFSDEEFDALASRPALSEQVLNRLVDLARAGGPMNTRRHPLATYAALYRSGHPLPPEFLTSWTDQMQWLCGRPSDLPEDALASLAVFAAHPDVTDAVVLEVADRAAGYRAFSHAAPNHPTLLALDLHHLPSRSRPVGMSNPGWVLALAAMLRVRAGDRPGALSAVGPIVRQLQVSDDAPYVEDLLDAAFSAASAG